MITYFFLRCLVTSILFPYILSDKLYDPYDLSQPQPTKISSIHSDVSQEQKHPKPNTVPVQSTDLKDINEEQVSQMKLQCNLSALPVLKRFIRSFLSLFPKSNKSNYLMQVTLKLSEQESLRKFVEGNDNVYDTEQILISMIKTIKLENESTSSWLNIKFLDLLMSGVFQVLVGSVITILVFMCRKFTSPQKIVKELLIISLMISFVMKWYYLYLKADVSRHTAVIKGVPKECLEKHQTAWNIISNLPKYWFSIPDDQCANYYEAIFINPILKVPPTEVVAETLVTFFLKPLQIVGENIGLFIQRLCAQLPVQLQFVVLPGLFIFLCFISIMCFGYRISIPFLLNLAPEERDRLQPVREKQFVDCIQNMQELIHSMKEESNEMRRRQTDSEALVSKLKS